ncbi:MAG: DUF1127 domain-containing protein [Rhodospirillaceae bacterium]|nr:DUF1127 domain-containing protein [Rhodospirillaceae bacterium]
MNSNEIHIPSGSVRAFALALLSIITNTVNAVKKEIGYRSAVRELQSMSNRNLSDMGIERHEIERLVRTSADVSIASLKSEAEVINFPVASETAEKDLVAA